MNQRITVVIGLAVGSTSVLPAQAVDPPRLVVFVSVDQMRADFVERFGTLWTGGLARMTEGGAVFTAARHDHAFTETAPGHATLVTGTHPARSGIVSNDWWDRVAERNTYAVEDSAAPILGVPAAPGRSPVNLLRTAVGDWLKQASPGSKVFSVAIKDRVAVLMGGHQSDGAFWYDYDSGRYVTSSYYAESYPDWVVHFNDSGPVGGHLQRVWTKLLPEEAYRLSREDDFAAEADSVHATFPHPVDLQDSTQASPFEELAYTPYGDALTLALARDLIVHEGLGTDATPDLLFIGASSADLIGHRYGAYSQEVQDYYVRLDGLLAELFAFLDERVGGGNYAVVLTSDHGVATMPEEAVRRGIDAARVGSNDFREELVAGITTAYQEVELYGQPLLSLLHPLGLRVDFPDTEMTDGQSARMRRIVSIELRKARVIAETYTYDELLTGEDRGREWFRLYRNSFHPDRAADIVLRYREHYVFPRSLPASHGSPYDYDARVPLMFYGPGVAPGRVDTAVRTVDVAPTVAGLLGIQAPADLDGESLMGTLTDGSR